MNLFELLKTEEALKAARDRAKETGSSWKAMGAAFASLGKNLIQTLSDPLVTIGLLLKAFKTIKDLLFSIDTESENFARSMNMTYEASLGTFKELRKINGDSLATATDYMNS